MAVEACPRYWFDKQPSYDGHLKLVGDPGPWIKHNPPSRLLVRSLYLDFGPSEGIEAEVGDSIGELTRLPNLEELTLHHCKLEKLPTNLLQLLSLTRLWLVSCHNITELPANLGQLKNLTYLTLECCINITKLPETLGQSKSLTYLTLNGCINITELPATLGHLESLIELSLINCNITELPETLGQLKSLIELSLINCHITELPETLGQLKSLIHLSLEYCENITKLPATLGHLESLIDLTLNNCINITELPETLGQLKILTHLSLQGCNNITKLPATFEHLESLTSLSPFECNNITELPANLGQLQSLGHLSLLHCHNITELPETLGHLESLTHLSLYYCHKIKSLPNSMKNLSNLKEMCIFHCSSLTELPVDLKVLDLRLGNCPIKSLPKGLICQHLEFNGCNMKPPSDIASIDEPSLGEPKMEVIAHGGNNHQALEIRQNMNLQSGIASVNEAGFEEFELDVIVEQDVAHGGNNHHALENRQNNNPQSDNVKRKTQGKEITLEMIQPFLSKNTRLVDAAEQLNVSRSTLKRRLKEFKIEWPSCRKGKQHVNEKKRKRAAEQPSGSNTSEHNLMNPTNPAVGDNVWEYTAGANQLSMPKHESYNYNAFNSSTWNPTMGPVIDTVMATQCHTEGHQHAHEPLGRANKSTLFIVKATYNEDTVRFEFCLMYSIDKLYEEVGKRLELEVSSFKIQYVDEEKELIKMTSISDLELALNLSRRCGTNVVRLSVVAKT